MSLQSDCDSTPELSTSAPIITAAQQSSPQDTRRQQSSQERQPLSRERQLSSKERHTSSKKRRPSSKETQPSSKKKQPSSERPPSSQAEIDDREADSDLKLVEHAFIYLSDKTYPPECTKNEKRSTRRKAKKLTIVSGELYYKKKDGNEVCD